MIFVFMMPSLLVRSLKTMANADRRLWSSRLSVLIATPPVTNRCRRKSLSMVSETADPGAGFRRSSSYCYLVPMVPVGVPSRTLRVPPVAPAASGGAERGRRHSHGDRGNEGKRGSLLLPHLLII